MKPLAVGQDTGYTSSRYIDGQTNHKGYKFLYCMNDNVTYPKFIGAYTLQEVDRFKIYKNKITVVRDNGKKEVIRLKPNFNYYISINPMRYITDPITNKKAVRKTENLRGLDTFVIDLDIREEGIDYKKVADLLTDTLYSNLFDTGVLNQPNKTIFTGRGIQIWWYIDQISPSDRNIRKYKRVVEAMLDEIKHIVNDHYELSSVIEVDGAVSKRLYGIVRLAGVNQASKLAVECLRKHNGQYTIEDFIDPNKLIPIEDTLDKHSITTLETPKGLVVEPEGRIKQVLYARSQIAKNVIEDSIIKGTYKGRRRNMLFMYYLHRVQIAEEVALQETLELNRRLPEPLSIKEIQTTFKIERSYRYSNESFYETLGVTEAYAKGLNKPKNHARDSKRKQTREEKIAYRKELLATDMTYKEIAEELGCTVRTVKRYAEQYNMQRNYRKGNN